VCPKQGNKAGEGSRAQVLWGMTEGTRVLWPGEKAAQGTCILMTEKNKVTSHINYVLQHYSDCVPFLSTVPNRTKPETTTEDLQP